MCYCCFQLQQIKFPFMILEMLRQTIEHACGALTSDFENILLYCIASSRVAQPASDVSELDLYVTTILDFNTLD